MLFRPWYNHLLAPSASEDENLHFWVFNDTKIRQLSTLLKIRLNKKPMFLPLFDKKSQFWKTIELF